MKASRRISLALALSLMLFLPVAFAANTVTLTSPKAQLNGEFGRSVAVSEGDPIVVIGAPAEDAGSTHAAGLAYVLDTSTGLFITLKSPTPQDTGRFGFSVAVSGTTVVVGAPFEPAGTPTPLAHAGHAYVFDATTGSSIATLTSPTPQQFGVFGYSVAVSGTTVVVGAFGESLSAGNAYVYDSTTNFQTPTTLTSPTPEANGQFGYSVAVSGTTVVVGAPVEHAGSPTPLVGAGHAYVFDATGGPPIKTLTSPNAQGVGFFGSSVAVSCTTVVVGAPDENVDGQFAAGHAYVYDASTGFPTPKTLTSPYAQGGGRFGFSVAVGGTTVVVGALFETVGLLANAGHAYSFDASTGFLTTTLTSDNAQAGGQFGISVAVTQIDPIVVVGAPAESGGGSAGAGHAYVFS